MNLLERIDLVIEIGKYLEANKSEWRSIKRKAFEKNPWFTEKFIQLACTNINTEFLQKDKLLK